MAKTHYLFFLLTTTTLKLSPFAHSFTFLQRHGFPNTVNPNLHPQITRPYQAQTNNRRLRHPHPNHRHQPATPPRILVPDRLPGLLRGSPGPGSGFLGRWVREGDRGRDKQGEDDNHLGEERPERGDGGGRFARKFKLVGGEVPEGESASGKGFVQGHVLCPECCLRTLH